MTLDAWRTLRCPDGADMTSEETDVTDLSSLANSLVVSSPVACALSSRSRNLCKVKGWVNFGIWGQYEKPKGCTVLCKGVPECDGAGISRIQKHGVVDITSGQLLVGRLAKDAADVAPVAQKMIQV